MIRTLNKHIFDCRKPGSSFDLKNRFKMPAKKAKVLVSAAVKCSLTPTFKKKLVKQQLGHSRGISETPSCLTRNNEKMIFSVKNSIKTSCEKLHIPDIRKKIFKKARISMSPRFEHSEFFKYLERSPDRSVQNSHDKLSLKNGSQAFFSVKSEINQQNYLKALGILEKSYKEESSQEFLYLRSICYLNLNNYEKALQDFLNIKAKKIFLRPAVFLGMFKCYEQTGKDEEAIKSLNLCLKYFPDNLQAYFFRGKFFVEHKMYEKAIRDLKKIKTNEAFWLLFLCWKKKNNYENAMKYLKKYGHSDYTNHKYLQELGKLEYKLKDFDSSLKSLYCALHLEPENTETQYYIGKNKLLLNHYEDCELFLEKTAQDTLNQTLSSRAVYKLAFLKQKQSDFYGSYNTLYRKSLSLKSFTKKCLSKYIEATYRVIQNNFSEAIDLFTELINLKSKYPTLFTCLVLRAFSYFSNNCFEQAIDDFQEARMIEELDNSSEFNYRMAQAMKKYTDKNYAEVLEMLDSGFFDNFLNPMSSILRVRCKIFTQISPEYSFPDALTEIYRIKISKIDSEVYELKALLNYFSNCFEECLENINKCISHSEKNTCSMFVLRGFCYIKLKIYHEAYNNFNMAISINGDIENMYAYRGMCAFFTGNDSLAIDDFLYISHSKDPNGFMLSIYLLIVSGGIKDALLLLDRVDNDFENRLLRAHCYLLTENYSECLKVLCSLDLAQEIKNDIFTVESLNKNMIKSQGPGALFTLKYSLWYQAIDYFYHKDYILALSLLEQTLQNIQNNPNDISFQDNLIIEEEHCEISYNIGLINFMINTSVRII